MGSRPHYAEDDDFGGDFPGSGSSKRHSGDKRNLEDLDVGVDDVYSSKTGKSKVEKSGPGAATGTILSLRESLEKCKDNLATSESELEAARTEIQNWHSAFRNLPGIPADKSPEPGYMSSILKRLKSREESSKEQLDKAKKREAAFIITHAKREQEIADSKIDASGSTVRGRIRSNRCWTPGEDAALANALVELCNAGHWKADNGFRSGYLIQVEKMLEVTLPTSNFKANPHIESRVKTLKKQTRAISKMLTNSSGFSWDDESKSIVCESGIYEDWVKSHPNAKGLRNKPFPLYDMLVEVFGKDRATGDMAESAADAASNPFVDTADTFDPHESHPCVDPLDAEFQNQADMSNDFFQTQVDSTFPEHASAGITPISSKLPVHDNRSKNSDLGELDATFGKFIDMNYENMMEQRQARARSHELQVKSHELQVKSHELQVAQAQLMERIGNAIANTNDELRMQKAINEIMALSGFSDTEKLDATIIVTGEPSKLKMFLLLPDNMKTQFVQRLLHP